MASMTQAMEGVPRPVVWAVGLTGFNAVVGFLFRAAWRVLDDRGTIIGVGSVITAVMLLTSWLVWRGLKWGGIAFIVINALNALLAIPALFEGEVAFAIGGLISAALSVAAIVFVLRPEAKPHWQH
jgi:hypothetical protein